MSVRFLVIAAALAVLAGCGGGSSSTDSTGTSSTGGALSKQDYAVQLRRAVIPLTAASRQLQGVDPTNRQAAASAVAADDDALKKASQEIAALDPPSVAAGSNAILVTSMNRFENVVARFEQALRSGTHQEVVAQARAIGGAQQSFLATVAKVQKRLQSEGIPLSPP